MADVKAIRIAIADKLDGVFGEQTVDGEAWTVSPTLVTQPDVPAMVVLKGPTKYGEAMGIGTLQMLTLLVVAYVSVGATEETQDLLDDLLAPSGDRSVYQALMVPDLNTQVTLGGKCADLGVVADSGHRLYPVGGVDYLGADWQLEVYA